MAEPDIPELLAVGQWTWQNFIGGRTGKDLETAPKHIPLDLRRDYAPLLPSPLRSSQQKVGINNPQVPSCHIRSWCKQLFVRTKA